MSNILVISPHMDDETLGCGGTLLKAKDNGDDIFCLNITQIELDTHNKKEQWEYIMKIYGFKGYWSFFYPSSSLKYEDISGLIINISSFIREWKPETVFIPHRGDIHTDHYIVSRACLSALKPMYQKQIGVKKILAYEVLSSTEQSIEYGFCPNVFIDITTYSDYLTDYYIKKKTEFLKMYETEKQSYPLPREASAITALARYRGATISVEYAEAFMLIKEII